MKSGHRKFTGRLVCIIFIISILLSSFSGVASATDSSSTQNAFLMVLTFTTAQRVDFVNDVLANNTISLDQRVTLAKSDYLTSLSSAEIKSFLQQYDSFDILQQQAILLSLIDGMPSNTIIGSTDSFPNIASYINSEITGNGSGLINGQTNVGIRLMAKVLSTVATFDGPVAHDPLTDSTTKIVLNAPYDELVDSAVDGLIASFDSLKSKISSRPETTSCEKLLGYLQDGINSVTNAAIEMPHFKKCLRDFDSNVYDGTNYYLAPQPTPPATPISTPMPTSAPMSSPTPTPTAASTPTPTSTSTPTPTSTAAPTPSETPDVTPTGAASPTSDMSPTSTPADTVTPPQTATLTPTTTALPATPSPTGTIAPTATALPTPSATPLPKPPKAPHVNAMDDNDTKVLGTAEPGMTIFIKLGSVTVARGKVAKNGSFSLTIEKQEAKTELSAIAENSMGLASISTKFSVKYICPPVFNSLDNNDKSVRGQAEKGATVKLTVKGKTIGSAVAKNDGTFVLNIKPLKAGTVVEGTAKDKKGHVSSTTKAIVNDARHKV